MVFPKPKTVWVKSENYGYPRGRPGRNGRQIIGICYHIAEGSRKSVESWFQSKKSSASSHFLVCRNGEVVQFVAEEDAAWTQGDVAAVTWPLYDPKVNPNLVLLSVEHEGYTQNPWTEEMYQADLALTLHLCERFAIPPRRPYLLGHNELNGKTRPHCPGDNFPWERLINDVQQSYVAQKLPWMWDGLQAGKAAGLSDATRPLDYALRGETMTFLVRLLDRLGIRPGGPDPGPQAPEAPDWMQPYIRRAMQFRISDGSRALEEATRAEAMTMAVRALDLIAPPTAPGAQDPVERAREEQISDGTRPEDPVLRGEAVVMAVRLLERFL